MCAAACCCSVPQGSEMAAHGHVGRSGNNCQRGLPTPAGLFEVGGVKIPQPFDGDGLLAIFAFKGGRAFFANRYVRTKGAMRRVLMGRRWGPLVA